MDASNPWKNAGGGALDQQLFKGSSPTALPSKQTERPNARTETSTRENKQSSKQVRLPSSDTTKDPTILQTPPLKPERPNASTGERRAIKRHSYEFYKDQIDAIKALALEDQNKGGDGNKSKMVREAIDMYLESRKNITERPNVSTPERPIGRTSHDSNARTDERTNVR